MNILVVNPVLPRVNSFGACEADRMQNVRDLLRYGHRVHLLTRRAVHTPADQITALYAQLGVQSITLVEPKHQRSLRRWVHPALLDGAAWTYADVPFQTALRQRIDRTKPDLIWCHGSYLWPVIQGAKPIPTVVRSVNFESQSFLEERSPTLPNRVRSFAKALGEAQAVRASVLAAITPDEAQIYQHINPRATVEILPLRALPTVLREPVAPPDVSPLRVFSMGASYNVEHNRAQLEFIVREIIPRIRQAAPGQYEFHIMGSKVPSELLALAADDLIFDGYVQDIDAHLAGMHIALSPRLYGTGMQQKVFEPLARGFPVVTHQKALAGYPFIAGEEYLVAEDADSFVAALLELRSAERRRRMGQYAYHRSAELFSRERIDQTVKHILAVAIDTIHATKRQE